jgi:hypothetical protein
MTHVCVVQFDLIRNGLVWRLAAYNAPLLDVPSAHKQWDPSQHIPEMDAVPRILQLLNGGKE